MASAKDDLAEAVFTKYDVNSDGKMSNTELADALKELDLTLKPELLNAIIEHNEKPPKNGFLEFAEFTALVTDLKAIKADKREEVIDYFIAFDTDKNGYIDIDDLKKVLVSVGIGSHDAPVLAAAVASIADINADDKITVVELAGYLSTDLDKV
ncbi:hypothetical protein Bbelb_116620 [Branchiostoma belcheri]|nr:hypothetical protein Bbelb_116620 [Branchiostoma belcheri]